MDQSECRRREQDAFDAAQKLAFLLAVFAYETLGSFTLAMVFMLSPPQLVLMTATMLFRQAGRLVAFFGNLLMDRLGVTRAYNFANRQQPGSSSGGTGPQATKPETAHATAVAATTLAETTTTSVSPPTTAALHAQDTPSPKKQQETAEPPSVEAAPAQDSGDDDVPETATAQWARMKKAAKARQRAWLGASARGLRSLRAESSGDETGDHEGVVSG